MTEPHLVRSRWPSPLAAEVLEKSEAIDSVEAKVAALRDEVVELEAEQQSLQLRLRHRTPLVLLTPPVPGHAPRLVHVQHHDHEQNHRAANGVDQCAPQHAEIVTGRCRIRCYVCEVADCLRFYQQDDSGNYGQQE